MNLFTLPKDKKAFVRAIVSQDGEIDAKLREIGFAEGDEVEVLHYGPFGKSPICVRLNGTLIALRSKEALAIEVKMQ